VGQDPQGRKFSLEGAQFGQGRIATGVIDEDHFVGAALEGGGDLAGQGGCCAGLVVDRNDDGNFGSLGAVHVGCLNDIGAC
jgi:hypothetical protein